MPDFFDRLLARSVPTSRAGGTSSAGDAVRVRPRLPQPFERIEAVRSELPLPDEPTPALAPSLQPPAVREVLRERKVRTDYLSVVQAAEPTPSREELTAHTIPGAFADREPAGPLLSPAAELSQGPREALEGRSTRRSEQRAAPASAGTQPSSPVRVAAPTGAPIAPAPTTARPRPVDSAAARPAARSGTGRRQQQPAERVVHVQIGRLEVSAAAPGSRDPRNAAAPDRRPGRPAPTLALDAFLSREEKRS